MALVSTALGRPAAVVGTTVPINLVAPGQVWGDRVNALDFRFAKIVRFGRARNTIGIDIYNITNSDAILTYNQTFNPAVTTGSQAWLAPTSVLTPRFVKIGAQIDSQPPHAPAPGYRAPGAGAACSREFRVVQAFRPAWTGGPEGPHYTRMKTA